MAGWGWLSAVDFALPGTKKKDRAIPAAVLCAWCTHGKLVMRSQG
jgi:hypothetical protein